MVPKGPAPYCSTAITVTPVSGRRSDEFNMPGSNSVALDQPLGDHDTLDLIRAFADDEERRIAVKALDWEFLAVPVAAVNAHRLKRVLDGRFGREQLCHPSFEVAPLAAIKSFGGLTDQKTRDRKSVV